MSGPAENLTPMVHAAQNRCFGCGQGNPLGLQLEFLLATDGSVVSLPTVPESFDGTRDTCTGASLQHYWMKP